MQIDGSRLLKSLGIAIAAALLMIRPWPGQTEARDLWGMLGAVLGIWAVLYRAWPAVAHVPLRVALPRMIPGMVIGLIAASFAPPAIARLTGWDDATASLAFLAILFVAVAALVVRQIVRLRGAQRTRDAVV